MILSGKGIATQIEEEIRQKIGAGAPGLAVLLVGDNPSSKTYVRMKQKACARVGIRSYLHELPDTLSEEALLEEIHRLNGDPDIDGILVQLPLPPQMRPLTILEALDPTKDIDGFHPINMGKLLLGLPNAFVPCTPLGIQVLLERANIPCAGKHVVIVGRSQIVGKPLAALLMQKGENANATVTVAHSQTENLSEITRSADILVAAVGSPEFITAEMVREGAVVIDVGINRQGEKLVGDVAFDEVAPKCHAITPVPGGVGPMTVAMLLRNTWLSYQRRHP